LSIGFRGGLRPSEAGLRGALDAFGCDSARSQKPDDTRAGMVAHDDVFGDANGVAKGDPDES
jgi:hypothetical protein